MENSIVNKKKVLLSTLFIPLAVPSVGLYLGLTDLEDFLPTFFGFAFLGLIYGFYIYTPTILVCLLIEAIAIQKNTKPVEVVMILILEAILAWFIIHYVFALGPDATQFSVIIALAIASTQGLRILYLFLKDRIHNESTLKDKIEIIDDLK